MPLDAVRARLQRLRAFLHPSIDRADPEERFRLRVIRTQAQVTSAAFFIPVVIYLLGVADKPSPTYLIVIAIAAGLMTISCLWLLRKRAHRASHFLVPVAFLLPDVVLPFGLTVELIYPVLIIMLYAMLLLPPWANVALHTIHLSIIAGFIAFTDTYSLFPPGGNVNATHYFSTYLILHAIGTVYTVNFRIHLRGVTEELRERSQELAYLNAHLEDELQRRTEQLEHQQDELSKRRRAEVVATIASGIAHDLRNMLGILQVNMDVVEMRASHHGTVADPQAAEARKRIHRALDRGRQLVERMFAAVRHDPLVRSPVTVEALFEELVDLARSTLPAHVRLVQEHACPQAVVEADQAQLEQVFLNLIRNAVAAIGDDPGEIRIASHVDDGRLHIVVVDTGGGIPPHHLERIFDPFFTTKPRGRGTGLGLAQARRIIEEHDGTIEAESIVDVGTTFRISLPLAAAPSSPKRLRSGDTDGSNPVTILAEDEDDIAEVIASTLPATQVVQVRNVREAIRAVTDPTRNVTLLILDLTLAGGSGVHVFEAARRVRPDLPVIVTTGRLESPDLDRLRSAPHTAFLSKPFHLRDLRAAVARMVGRRIAAAGADATQASG
ncbi:MAG: response regulator [Deltaproteobacteria bacterium]|nr:MAG: response regulator [Deltaproteobacteria bacterium]